MKKTLLLISMFVGTLFMASCANDTDIVSPNNEENTTIVKDQAQATVLFNVKDNTIGTRSASVGENWPSSDIKSKAEQIVNTVYTTPKNQGVSFFTSNYSVNLTTDKGGSITKWNGSTTLSLTETNNISVTLTENSAGAYPKFKTATGWINISNIDLDSENPTFTSDNYGGDIVIKSITVSSIGKVNVTLQVNLEYDSYLLVAPGSEWSILTNVKGFTSLKFNGTSFFTNSSLSKNWFYYWANGNGYVLGKGTLLSYGFNLYSDNSNDIKVENGKWYCLFASLNSAGEGEDDNPDTKTVHEFGGENGIVPTANDIVSGGTIR